MKKFALNLIYIIPVLGLIAGLSLGVAIPLFMIFGLYLIKDHIKVSFVDFKLEILFFCLLFLSCFWALNPVASFISCLKVLAYSLATYILIMQREFLFKQIPVRSQKCMWVLLAAIALFYIEFISGGAMNIWFREVFQNKINQPFYLSNLDRGCTLLSLFAWVVIAQLLYSYKTMLAMLIYIITLVTLGISDSLAGFLGFIVAGGVFVLTKYSFFRSPKFLSFILSIGSLIFIIMAIKLNPYQLSESAKSLPLSAKHRLFIWDFTAEKIMEKPIMGWGHGASRQIQVEDDKIIVYEGVDLHPLPTHPHNNLLQILLENGVLGLVLYMLLACKYLFIWNKSFQKSKSARDKSLQAAGYACFSTFFVISMISFNMWQSWWMCSFLWIALLFTLVRSTD